jgi:predicted AlkP superfamily phosphohydrolase/phosphomutase/tetratricopeptide (TPR) repeat protein
VLVVVAVVALAIWIVRRGGEKGAGVGEEGVPAASIPITETLTKVAILGIDGADWEIIDPLIEAGELPTLAGLRKRGAWGNMKSMHPMLSPLLWTTVATGKPPAEHGIIDFLMKDSKTGQVVPVTSRWRKTKALWSIFTDVGKTSSFIAWWASWPAEPVLGHVVSDRVAYSLFGYEAGEVDRAGATYPPEYFRDIHDLIVDDSRIGFEEINKFVKITEDEFRAGRARVEEHPGVAYREPVNHLTKILASAHTYQAIAKDILADAQPDLFALYYQGIDEVGHRFAHYMPPKMGMVNEVDYSKYRDAVFNFYRFQDRLLAEILERLDPSTVVIVMSDHGFMNGSARPPDDPPYIEGTPGLWHRRYGIVILAGPPIRPGRLDTTELMDITPTVLYLSGLPVGGDMRGRVIREAIDDDFLARYPMRSFPSYDAIGDSARPPQEIVADAGVEREILQRLRNLGYVGDGADAASGTGVAGGPPASIDFPRPDGETLLSGNLNEASLHFRNKDYAKAEAVIGKVLSSAPNFAPGLAMASKIYAEQKRYGPAIDAARKAAHNDPEGERTIYKRLSQLYLDSGRSDEGLAFLRQAAKEHADVPEIRAAIGSLLLGVGETEEAEKELIAALHLDPRQGEPLSDLHKIYRGTPKVLSLEPIVRQGLADNDKSVVHHNWMGIIYEWKKQIPEAERSFLRAMELDPDYAATMANLGALYGRTGRLEEAVTILTRSVEKEPENQESWVNLGGALGRLHRPGEAIEALETAREMGVRTTVLFNALALAYLEIRKPEKARRFLEESLTIDPDQTDARELLEVMDQSS